MRATILNASAGSGKTYQLAYNYVRDVVEQPDLYRHILAVTFTNKATEEMKSRILSEIHKLASGAPDSYLGRLCEELRLDADTVRQRACTVRSKILHDYSRFTILTIDTFFQRILRAFIKELGIELDYTVEIETESILARSADLLVEQITEDSELQRWLTEFVDERIEEGRKWDIREGILALGGELFKEKNKAALTGARPKQELGRLIGRTLGRAKSSKERMQAVAQQAVRIMDEAGVGPADFKGKSRSFAHCFQAVAAGAVGPFTDTARKMSLTTEGWCAAGSPAAPLVARLQPLLREMCGLYDANVRIWNTAELLRENYRSFALLADLYARVQQMCDQQNLMLLSETKYILSEFIGHNDAPFIYEKVGNRFERFMIDEFQDTSAREWENFLPLLRNAMAQSDRPSVLLVGDIKQSIYRWRGGDWRILHSGAQQALGGPEEAPIVPLKENWRSLPTVVEFNNRMIGRLVETDDARLDASLAEAVGRGALAPAAAAELRGMLRKAYADHAQTPRKRGAHPGYVRIDTCPGPPPVVDRIKELLDKGFRPKEILILVRSATDGARAAATLLDFKRTNQDPRYRFDVMTQEALLIGKAPVCNFVIAAMQLAVAPDESLARAVYNRYRGYDFDRPLDDGTRDFFESLRMRSPEEAFERIVLHADLQHDRDQTAYLQALHEQVISFCANRIADLPLFIKWWQETGRNRSLSVEESETTIEITTIHKAKGLEKRAVLIPYCTWQLDPKSSGAVNNIVWAEAADDELEGLGRFPVKYKRTMADSAFSDEYYREQVYAHVDNINLLYVALTRAKESLHVFVPDTGTKNPTVGSLMVAALETGGDGVRIGEMRGRHTVSEAGERFEFGEFAGPDDGSPAADGPTHTILEEYPTAEANPRLRLPSQRYFDEETQVELSPRNFGILMHRVFEKAATEAEIDRAVADMRADGVIGAADAEILRGMIARTFEDPLVHGWFDGSWTEVRNEHEIIVPGDASVRRPDRVMTRGTEAVVVDYKFGALETERHRRQVASYLALLRRMGYTEVSGYLWYVKLGTIERV